MIYSERVPNHLINETSPYLLQHAYNPVDWYPWGDEAFEKAKNENKLIFLSIGYSTCHWCHVMAHESFEDERVAKILNEHYVCIKVDREERLDVDSIYMNVCQMVTGTGGWPLNLWLTPQKKPIYAGTYFPISSHYGKPGLLTIITKLNQMWLKDSEELIGKSEEILGIIKKSSLNDPESVQPFVIEEAVRTLKGNFDSNFGGFSKAPKFPTTHQLLFLMTYYEKHPEDDTIMPMVEKTLDSMFKGGIYDHIGGGFSRYSVDEKWLVPHFEKMLYDNVLLLKVYNDAYRLTKQNRYRLIAYDIVRFLERDLMSEEGAFYTALDADSDGEEGKYYVFTKEEVEKILGAKSEAFCHKYHITSKGNFERKNIANLIGENIEAYPVYVEEKEQLLDYREKRVKPSLDYKILLSVNGLALDAFSHMYRVYGDEKLLKIASGIYNFIQKKLYNNNDLCSSFAKGVARKNPVLEDYAFYISGLIELYEVTMDESILLEGQRLTKKCVDLFWDDEDGGFYQSKEDDSELILRHKEAYDSAIFSGNSVMAMNMLKMSRITGENQLEKYYDQLIKAFGKSINNGPSYFGYMLTSLIHRVKGTKDLVVAVKHKQETREALETLRHTSLNFFTYRITDNDLYKKSVDERITYYICEDETCLPPVFELK